MREIKNREEFAKYVNFGGYAVIKIDLNQKAFMDTIYHGDKVRVDFGHFKTGERYLDGGELIYNIKDNHFEIASWGSCLSARFCYEDAMERVEYSQAPIIDEGDEVVIIVHNSETKEVKAYVYKAVHKKQFCQTMIEFE